MSAVVNLSVILLPLWQAGLSVWIKKGGPRFLPNDRRLSFINSESTLDMQ
jgi:hypothetical protein